MEELWNLENTGDCVELESIHVTDAYPPKLEREESKAEAWPPRLTRLLNPIAIIGDVVTEIVSDLEKKGKEIEADLQKADARDGVIPTVGFISASDVISDDKSTSKNLDVNEHYAEDMARRDATMARYEAAQSRNLERMQETLDRIDQIRERQEANLKNQVSFDAPKYNGV